MVRVDESQDSRVPEAANHDIHTCEPNTIESFSLRRAWRRPIGVPEQCTECFSLVTWNVWRDNIMDGGEFHEPQTWSHRKESLLGLLEHCRPDVLCLQEASPTILAAILNTMGPVGYESVSHDEETILFRRDRFQLLDSGRALLDRAPEGYEHQARDEFMVWARLQPLFLTTSGGHVNDRTLLVCTAHLTWMGGACEIVTGMSRRFAQTHAVCDHVQRMTQSQTPKQAVIFCGDLNDSYLPGRILSDRLSMRDCFVDDGARPAPPTHPTPASNFGVGDRSTRGFETLDWIFGSPNLSSSAPCVVDTRDPRSGRHASDHLPVATQYRFLPC